MAMLAEPSVAEGTMLFAAPDKMRWEYTKPYASALIVNGEHIIKVTIIPTRLEDSTTGKVASSTEPSTTFAVMAKSTTTK